MYVPIYAPITGWQIKLYICYFSYQCHGNYDNFLIRVPKKEKLLANFQLDKNILNFYNLIYISKFGDIFHQFMVENSKEINLTNLRPKIWNALGSNYFGWLSQKKTKKQSFNITKEKKKPIKAHWVLYLMP